ncbi:hypothetical protein BJV82DRAFT_594138 [Fennellomyces sp. T-0311]|nr:hypothetical protein BJV82DRAFT_594138 [Fennellomyces sp. T-0311]
MDLFPSPPSSPIQHDDHQDEKVVCGSCDKVLSSDWFCSDCHKRCETCNRFLSADEHCSRCWSFDTLHNVYVRKPRHHQHIIYHPPPSPPNHHVLSYPSAAMHYHATTMTSLPHSFY